MSRAPNARYADGTEVRLGDLAEVVYPPDIFVSEGEVVSVASNGRIELRWTNLNVIPRRMWIHGSRCELVHRNNANKGVLNGFTPHLRPAI